MRLLRTDFGLQVFIMKQTVPSSMSRIIPIANWRDAPQQETLAAIMLPSHRHTTSITEQDSNNNDFAFHIDSSVGMLNSIDLSTLVISDEQKQRFNRAMRFFGLSPKLRILQALDEHDLNGPILTPEQKRTGPTDAEAKDIRDRLDAKVKGDLFLHTALLALISTQCLRTPNGHSCSICFPSPITCNNPSHVRCSTLTNDEAASGPY
jgi:hypothetical protein